ncbi:hypothetical protein GF312_01405 [Candidatus Poribacteria bacterium]|nr:hypothetical protein [Candidatus Poribacteria bacterium]
MAKVWGSYLHGIFDNDGFRMVFVNYLRKKKGLKIINESEGFIFNHDKQKQYDLLAENVREHLDMIKIYQILNEKNI